MGSENHGLSERKKQILKAIVDAHIEGGGPVGSKYILQNRQLTSFLKIRGEGQNIFLAEAELSDYGGDSLDL